MFTIQIERLILPMMVVFAVMFLVWYLALRRLADRLRDRHPDTYDELGLDSTFTRSSAANRALLHFLSGKRYLRLRDPEVSRVAAFLHRLLWVYVVTMLLVVGLGFHLAGLEHDEGTAAAAGNRVAADAVPADAAAAQRREEGFTSHRGKRYAEAVQAYNDVERMSGYDGELLYWRAMAYWRLGQPEDALKDLRRLVQLEPTNFEVHQYLARLLQQEKRLDEALEAWTRYLSHAGSDPNGWLERGRLHHRNGNLAEARDDAGKACQLGHSGACAWAQGLK